MGNRSGAARQLKRFVDYFAKETGIDMYAFVQAIEAWEREPEYLRIIHELVNCNYDAGTKARALELLGGNHDNGSHNQGDILDWTC